jgi:hypothetical protein
MPGLFLCAFLMLTLLPPAISAQMTFSRRVYSEKDRSYQQIWMWNPSEGSFTPITKSDRNHFSPECSADGKYIWFRSGSEASDDSELWRFDRKSSVEQKFSPSKPVAVKAAAMAECVQPVWAQDKSRFACAKGRNIFLYEAKTKRLIGKPLFTERRTPPTVVGWSQNGKWLLVSTVGESDNSTSRQSDFFILNIGRMAWIPAGAGNDAKWIPGSARIVYSTPRELEPITPSSTHQEWTSHLVMFDPETRRRAQVTTGVTNDIQPAACAAGAYQPDKRSKLRPSKKAESAARK